MVIFELSVVGPIRGCHCSRGPSLAVILGVSRSNKSQVEPANDCRSDSAVIQPYRLQHGLDKRPDSVLLLCACPEMEGGRKGKSLTRFSSFRFVDISRLIRVGY